MSFQFNVRTPAGDVSTLTVDIGRPLFILGANGSGKSSLMHWFYQQFGDALRIVAHRQTWFVSNAVEIFPRDLPNLPVQIKSRDSQAEARWLDHLGVQRIALAIASVVQSENELARSIASAARAGEAEQLKDLLAKQGPLDRISELLRDSGLPIKIVMNEGEQMLAAKNGATPYSIAELSDGERNAVLIAASVLTAKPNGLILIDEPEKHLYRSIISPLLTSLFASRPDCAFVISSHELELPLSHPSSATILLRGCNYQPGPNWSWDFDLLEPETEISPDLKRQILGARRKILFVEGDNQSLDQPLYNIVFPDLSVVAKAASATLITRSRVSVGHRVCIGLKRLESWTMTVEANLKSIN